MQNLPSFLSAHFKATEFCCKCGCNGLFYVQELIDVLEDVRAHFNKPIIITSGYRCEAHNKKVGGTANSQHLLGKAADIVIREVDSKIVSDYLEKKYQEKYGIGRYKTFTHIDVRKNKARWSV